MKKERGKIPVSAAQRLSEQYNCPVVLIYAIENTGENFTVTTYGQTRSLCRHAADLGRKFAQAVMSAKVVPAESEPTDVPDQPAIFESAGEEEVRSDKCDNGRLAAGDDRVAAEGGRRS